MKILIVAAYNKERFAPFVVEQSIALQEQGIEIAYFGIVGKGIGGYLKNRKLLIDKIKLFSPDIIHAHYGLSGLLATLQRKTPVVITYHGSDINLNNVLRLSKIAMKLSMFNIFVSQKNVDRAGVKNKFALIPCGVDMSIFRPIPKDYARKQLHIAKDDKVVLFSGAFSNRVKNAELALDAIRRLEGVRLLELANYSREEVALLMNAVDTVLMTSHTEGSPQFIKEAMACNCPIVSVDVGDVEDVIKNTLGCFIAARTVDDVAAKLQQALAFSGRTNGRARIETLGLDAESVAIKLKAIYQSLLQ